MFQKKKLSREKQGVVMRWIATALTFVVAGIGAWYWFSYTSTSIASNGTEAVILEPGPSEVIQTVPPPSGERTAAIEQLDCRVLKPTPSVDIVTEAATADGPAPTHTKVKTIVITRSEAPQPKVAGAEPAAPQLEVNSWVIVTGNRVNVRETPNSSGRRLARYVRDTKLERLDERGSWVKVKHSETGKIGWIYRKFLKEVPSVITETNQPAA